MFSSSSSSTNSGSNGWLMPYQPLAERLLLTGPVRIVAYSTAGVIDRFIRNGMTLNSVAGLVERAPNFGQRLATACARYLLLLPAPQQLRRQGMSFREDVLVRDPYHALRLAIAQWRAFAQLCVAAHDALNCKGPCAPLYYELHASTSAACCKASIDEYVEWLGQLERAVDNEYEPRVIKHATMATEDCDDDTAATAEDDADSAPPQPRTLKRAKKRVWYQQDEATTISSSSLPARSSPLSTTAAVAAATIVEAAAAQQQDDSSDSS